MSAWFPIDEADISLDLDKREVDIHVTTDDYGTIYATMTFEQIKELYGRLPFDPNDTPVGLESNAKPT